MEIRCKIDRRSFIGAILAQDRPEHRFYMILGRFEVLFWGSKMVENSIPKSSYFHASLATLLSTTGDPTSSNMKFQNKPNMQFFLELDKTSKSCSRLDGSLLSFRSLERSKIVLFFELFS